MIKIVVDTNVFISSFISKSGPPADIFYALERKKIQLVLSESVVTEYKKVLKYSHLRRLHKLNDKEIKEAITGIRQLGKVVTITKKVKRISRDPDDDKFLECAFNAKADYIISGDNHLLKLRIFEGIRILSPNTFVLFLKTEI